MIKINPSILSANFVHLKESLNVFAKNNINWIHFDVMDGNFVPNITFGDKICLDISEEFPQLNLEVHLMVKDPLKQIEIFAKTKVKRIFFHFEALSYRECYKAIDNIKFHKIQAGISWRPNTNIEQIFEYLEYVDAVLVMSVEPGKGGQTFLENTYQKISTLKNYREKKNLKFKILVDGGIKDNNYLKVISEGADEIIIGSYLYEKGIASSEILNKLLNE